jgi:hypothetical protein
LRIFERVPLGMAGEDKLMEMSGELDDGMLNWMVVKDILGVRMEGADMYGERERGKDSGNASLGPPAAVSASATTLGLRVEYLMHLRTDKELEASEPYPPGGIYYAVDGEKVSSIAKRLGVDLAKLLQLNRSIVGLGASSRLLESTRLLLPPRPHLRWTSSVSGLANFDELLIAFLQRAVTPSTAIVHPRMQAARTRVQEWYDQDIFPPEPPADKESKDGDDAGAASLRRVTGLKVGVSGGTPLLRLSGVAFGQNLPPWDVWAPVRGSWHRDVAVFLLQTLGVISWRLGRWRCTKLLKASGLVGSLDANAKPDKMLTDGASSDDDDDDDNDDSEGEGGKAPPKKAAPKQAAPKAGKAREHGAADARNGAHGGASVDDNLSVDGNFNSAPAPHFSSVPSAAGDDSMGRGGGGGSGADGGESGCTKVGAGPTVGAGGVGGARDKDGEGKGRDRGKSEGKAEKVGLPGSGQIGRSAFGAAASGAGMSVDGACKGNHSQGERAKARDGGGGKVAEPPEQVRGS